MNSRFAFLVCLGLVTACVKPPAPKPLPPPVEYEGPDLDAKRLPADEELDLLLDGTEFVTSSKGAARIAIPPLTVLGAPDKAWMGEAVAEVVSAGLSQRKQVSVLERGQLGKLIEEIERSKGDDASTSQTGKLLGAQFLVLGKLVPEGESFVAVLSPVRVEDGVKLPGVTVKLQGEDFSQSLAPAVQGIADSLLGKSGEAPPVPPSLGAEAMQLVAKARRLQNAGKPLDAQPLYAKALPKLSSSWRVEADYLQLMTDLGLKDWVKDRATRLLARMPNTDETVCARARIAIQQNADRTVNGAREALRIAGVCGDDAVVAVALVHYGLSVQSVDFVASRNAFKRALALKAGKDSGWVRCVAPEELYLLDSDEGGDWKGSRREHYEANAKICADVGNARSESIALQNAGWFAETPADRLALFKRAIEAARKVGGMRLHEAVVRYAAELREQGKPSEADGQLLELVGIGINRVNATHGGLPAEAAALDDELLQRAKVKRPPLATKETKSLIARAARLQLARALEAWASRTRDDSVRQADAYMAIVEKLDPPPPVDKSAPTDPFEAALAKAKLPLATIAAAKLPPPRGGAADAESAFFAIEEHFDALREEKASAASLRELVDAANKTARWVGSPRLVRRAMLMEARVEADAEHVDAAMSIARRSLELAKDDPEWEIQVLDLEVELFESSKPDQTYKAALKRAQLAKRISASAVEEQSYSAAYIGWSTKQITLAQALEGHSKLADESAAKGDFAVAGAALAHLARLHKIGTHVDGSDIAVRAHERRVGYLDKLEDPQLSAAARVDLLHEIAMEAYERLGDMKARSKLAADKAVVARMTDLRKRLDDLVAGGRSRDVARIVARLDPSLPGAPKIARQGLVWAKTFDDSAEYPVLAAGLYATLAKVETDFDARRAAFAKARDLYESASEYERALRMQEFLFDYTVNEADAWTVYGRCRSLASKGQLPSGECTMGIGGFAIGGGLGGYARLPDAPRLSDAKQLQDAVQDGVLGLPWVEKNWIPLERERYRTKVAVLAALAKDFLTFERLSGETRTYFTKTEPAPAQWRERLGEIVTVLAPIDAKRALTAARELSSLPGSTDAWRASIFWQFAAVARQAGDTAAETSFLEDGRKVAATYPKYLPNYDLYAVVADKKAANYVGLDKAYRAAAATVRKHNPEYRIRSWQFDVAAAQAKLLGGDAKGAFTALRAVTTSMAKDEEPLAPCFESFVNELAAAAANASKACGAATPFLERAKKLRLTCSPKTIANDTWSVGWMDGKEFTNFRAPACGTTTSEKDLEPMWP